MLTFTDKDTGRKVYIAHPENVLWYERFENHMRLHFGPGISVSTRETPEQVLAAIEAEGIAPPA